MSTNEMSSLEPPIPDPSAENTKREALPLELVLELSLEEHPARLRQRVLSLAWPIIGENLFETLLGVVDIMLVAGLGTAAIAGVGSGLQIMFFLMSALSALSIGSSILVAQAVGAEDEESASRLARQSLLWSVLLSVPIALIGFGLSHALIGLFSMAPNVSRIGVSYLQVTMGTIVVLVALTIASGVLRGAGDTRTPMIVTAIANVINAVLAFGLIYGHWGLPVLGAVGSAWATFAARAFALLLIVKALWRGRNGVRISGSGGWRPDWSIARKVLTLGIPASVEQMLMATAFLVLTILVARLGTDTLAAMRISLNALSFSFLPGFGFSMAASALIGQSIGAQQPRHGAGVARVATLWAVLWMSLIGALIFVFSTPIMRLFTHDVNVIRIGADSLRVVALSQPFWAVGMVQAGALRGTGDTLFPLLIGAIGIWSTVLLVWLGLTFLGGGLNMVWFAFLLTSPITATLTWRRFQSRIRELEQEGNGESQPPRLP